ncbi:MAG TPA: metallophosphoesterase [Ferruginibacter sp.]|nr:metallophosphoesterase [Ferruginibacter sp.]
MRSASGIFFLILLILLLDAYVFQAFKALVRKSRYRKRLIMGFLSLTVLTVIGAFVFFYVDPALLGKPLRTLLFSMIIGLFFAKLVAAVFFLIDDLRRGALWIGRKAIPARTHPVQSSSDSETISRSVFLSWVGFAAGGSLLGSLMYGFSNKYNYQVKKVPLSFSNLPDAFRGLKVVHISDIHAGSLLDVPAVQRGVRMIMGLKPDLIVFTGDMVNDRATELLPLTDVFKQLQAPMGVYSILGNHDYGDYVRWPYQGVSKEENLQALIRLQESMGWKVLLNEHVILKKGEDAIALIGVENWSNKSRFPAHGRLSDAHKGTESVGFKMLLTHDPSHWDAEVCNAYRDIDLTLCGHTHGMQFGVEVPGLKWSPVQYLYKQWAGLYSSGNQQLYVNRGFGFIGYPGRVGILPEITLLELS